MENWLTEQLLFIKRKRKLGMVDALQHVSTIETRLKSRKRVTPEEANRLAEVIEHANLPDPHKTTLLTAFMKDAAASRPVRRPSAPLQVEDLATANLPGLGGCAGNTVDTMQEQRHEFFYNHLTAGEWQLLTDKATAKQLTSRELATLIYRASARIGLCNIQEADFGKIVSIFSIIGAGAPTCGPPGVQTVNVLKCLFAALRKSFPKAQMVMVYPEDPCSLPEPWLRMSQSAGALIKCPHDISLLPVLQAQTPTRSTHWSVRAAVPHKSRLALGDRVANPHTAPNVVLTAGAAPSTPPCNVPSLLQQIIKTSLEQFMCQGRGGLGPSSVRFEKS